MVHRLREGTPDFPGQQRDHAGREVRMRIEAGPHRRAAQRHFAQRRLSPPDPIQTQLDLAGIPAELLAEPDRRGVLEVGPADLHHAVEFACLGSQGHVQPGQRRQELPLDHLHRGDVDGGRNDVVAGLPQVDVVIGVDQLAAARAAEQLGRPIGDHLVRIHIGGGAGPGLENVDREFRIPASLNHFPARLPDRLRHLLLDQTERLIHRRSSPFDQSQSPYEGPGKPKPADGKIPNRPRSLHAVVGISGHRHLPHRVPFGSRPGPAGSRISRLPAPWLPGLPPLRRLGPRGHCLPFAHVCHTACRVPDAPLISASTFHPRFHATILAIHVWPQPASS